MSARTPQVVVIGGGPGGYEAALVAAALGASVTLVDQDGVGGAAVLTDCVPSKALISTSDFMSRFAAAGGLGVGFEGTAGEHPEADASAVNGRILRLAAAQSRDICTRLEAVGVHVVRGAARLAGPATVEVAEGEAGAGQGEDRFGLRLTADTVLIATGAQPRIMDTAVPDGERILTWQQIYHLEQIPSRLVVIGSGVTGAELAHAYLGLGSEVVLVSSRDRVLPGEDADAASVVEEVFRRRGMQVLNRSRAAAVICRGRGVEVALTDGRKVHGSHALVAVGSTPRTIGLGLQAAGVQTSASGHIQVDRVSRTTAANVYAAGDCTGVLALASVAAMQGRIAMAHALGDAVAPLNLRGVSATVFTDPEIATVGYSAADVEAGRVDGRIVMLSLALNPRAKMQNLRDGFVKLIARAGVGTVVGGVVVAPRASELIFPVSVAVQNRLTVDQLASTFTVYPSLSGSVAEAARRLHDVAG